jgi:hypothetical protein
MVAYPRWRVRRLDSRGARRVDLAITAVVLSVAAMAWFGWGQAEPPSGWSPVLTAGSIVSIAVALLSGVTSWRRRSGEASMQDPAVRRAYWWIVGTEIAACLLGVAVLGVAGETRFLPAWILLVVGVHCLPLGRVFRIAELYPAGVVVSVMAVAAAITGAATSVAPSTVAGAGGGLVCLIAALFCLRRSRSATAEEGSS